MITIENPCDFDLIDAVYFKAACTQVLRFIGEAVQEMHDCGASIRLLVDQPALPAVHRDAGRQLLQHLADRQAAAQKLASDIEVFSQACWREDESHDVMRTPPDAHAQQAIRTWLEGIDEGEQRFVSHCRQAFDRARLSAGLASANGCNDPQVDVGVELAPIPSRECYRTCVWGKPLLIGRQRCTLGQMTAARLQPGSSDDAGGPLPDSQPSYLASRLMAQRLMPSELFGWVKAVPAGVAYSDTSTVWQPTAPPPGFDTHRSASLSEEVFGSWYLVVASQAASSNIRWAQECIQRACDLVGLLSQQPQLPQKHRDRYQTMADQVAVMQTLMPSLQTAIDAWVPSNVQRPVDASAALDATSDEARRIDQIQASIDSAVRRFEKLGSGALAMAETNGLPRARPAINYAQFDFEVELATGQTSESGLSGSEQAKRFRFKIDSYSFLPSAAATAQPAPPSDVSAVEIASQLDHEAGIHHGRAGWTQSLVEYLRLPPAFFLQFKSVHIVLTLQLHAWIWPYQPKLDAAGHATGRHDES